MSTVISTAATTEVTVTGVGLAVPGLAQAGDLLTGRRGNGFDPATGLTGRDLRHKDRATRLALRAVEPALRDAGLYGDERCSPDPATTAVIVSSNTGNLDSVCGFLDTIEERTSRALSPLGLPHTSASGTVGWIAIHFGLRGPTLTVSNGITGGLDALYWARNLIAVGRAETVVVVGVEPHNDVTGKLLGGPAVDGAAAVVLESAVRARARGARALVTVGGYAREANRAAAVGAARSGDTSPLGLWLTGDSEAAEGSGTLSTEQPNPVQLLDLQNTLGHCSGALGLLQCAAAVAHFDAGGSGAVLATARGADAEAALVFSPAAPGRTLR